MIIHVIYFAEFKEITGKEREEFNLVESTLEGLLNILFEKYNLRDLIWDEKNQKIHNLISIIINNQAIHEKNPALINLNHNDTITFLLPVSGG
ncbi:MAG: MoaD/ThiS family protein [Promethearchaeota archaeon]